MARPRSKNSRNNSTANLGFEAKLRFTANSYFVLSPLDFWICHLAPHCMAGFVLANGSMSSNQSGEGDICRAIEADLVDSMVSMVL
jgi:hypothetical protein